jgi:putative transposase
MISVVRRTQRNVTRWRDGEMALRWTAAGMLEAERQFRRVIGYRELGKLAVAVEREVASAAFPSPEMKEVREAVTV